MKATQAAKIVESRLGGYCSKRSEKESGWDQLDIIYYYVVGLSKQTKRDGQHGEYLAHIGIRGGVCVHSAIPLCVLCLIL